MKSRASFATALTMILIGAWFLAIELFPQLKSYAYGSTTWPLPIIGIGVLLGLIGLITWSPGFFVPACVVAGVGGILLYQNSSGDWASWAYVWALIPGFNGVGIFLSGIFGRDRKTVSGGLWMIFSSLILFAIFAAIFGEQDWAVYWPVLLIALGLLMLAQGLFRRR